MRMPNTVRTLRMKTMLPARNMSWFFSALRRTGEIVGKPNTREACRAPLINSGNVKPIVLTMGLMATRTGYL